VEHNHHLNGGKLMLSTNRKSPVRRLFEMPGMLLVVFLFAAGWSTTAAAADIITGSFRCEYNNPNDGVMALEIKGTQGIIVGERLSVQTGTTLLLQTDCEDLINAAAALANSNSSCTVGNRFEPIPRPTPLPSPTPIATPTPAPGEVKVEFVCSGAKGELTRIIEAFVANVLATFTP
jgi:hypothetical protein